MMNRREFFRRGLFGLTDSVKKQAPEIIKPKIRQTVLDVSILSASPQKADTMVHEFLSSHFGETMLRLRQSNLTGTFPGGLVVFRGNELYDFSEGVSLFSAALRQLVIDLQLKDTQSNPTLLRYTNATPPYSKSVEIFHRNRLVHALPLHENGAFKITGTLGQLECEIRNGKFSFIGSHCRYQICIAHPPIVSPGQRIICLPNEVTAIIGAHFG